jgi:hypothetical protein
MPRQAAPSASGPRFGRRHPELVRQRAPAEPHPAWPRPPHAVHLNERKLRRSWRACSTRTSSQPARHPLAVAPPPGHPYVFTTPGRSTKWATCPAIRQRHVRRQLQLARPGLDAVKPAATRALLQLYSYYGDDFKVECPTGSGQQMTLLEVAKELGERLVQHLPEGRVRRAAGYGRRAQVPDDPHWRDCCCSTNTSTATAAPASAPATRPAGPAAWRASSQGKELLLTPGADAASG